ncbi:hypothetical protein HMPREF1487_09069 [Pseudomonas sp. HPB0071]|nr:hypothetical protein HMPREF1487_09069 [Pseudomonas sp. HPB0071]
MPRPLPPLTFICPNCGWCTTTLGSSDIVRPGIDMFMSCPACRHKDLEQRQATRLEVFCKKATLTLQPKR